MTGVEFAQNASFDVRPMPTRMRRRWRRIADAPPGLRDALEREAGGRVRDEAGRSGRVVERPGVPEELLVRVELDVTGLAGRVRSDGRRRIGVYGNFASCLTIDDALADTDKSAPGSP